MAKKEKEFLKQTVFKNTTVEDVLQVVYEDVQENKDNLNAFIIKAIEIIGEDSDKLLMFTKNVNDLVSTGLKNTDMLMKSIEVIRRATQETGVGKSKEEEDGEDTVKVDLKAMLKSVKNIATA